jgi:hypothetical protein
MAQDTLYIKGGEKLVVENLRLRQQQYRFRYDNGTQRGTVLKSLIDSVLTAAKSKSAEPPQAEIQTSTTSPAWKFSSFFSLGLGNNVTINDPSGLADKTSFSLDVGIDAAANYQPTARRFAITNELHYMLGIQKQGLSTANPLQVAQDRLNTLHDASWKIGKSSAWNLNTIISISTPLITQFDGNTLHDYNRLGRISGLLSPYEIRLSPGIKFQPNATIRFSASPYSVQLLGVRMNDVAGKGLYITETDAAGNFKKSLINRLGAEINAWYDQQIGDWLQMQYRLTISGNYFEQITRNGKMDVLCITRVKLINNLFLTHRLVVQNSFANRFLKPFLNQNILLSFSNSF